MSYTRTITAPEMRSINRSVILEMIRRESPVSRTQISKQLQVSLPTVMRIVDELADEGLVRSSGETEWSGGRRRSLIEFNAQEHVVVALELGIPTFYGALIDLGGKVLHEIDLPVDCDSGEDYFDCLIKLIEALLDQPCLAEKRLRGIGIGTPGNIMRESGVVTWTPIFNWRDFPLKDKVIQRFGIPVIVERVSNLAAVGELWFGAGQGTENLVEIMVAARGLGAGIIVDGALYRGANQAAAEIGALLPGTVFLSRDYDHWGVMDSIVSDVGIVNRALQVGPGRGGPAGDPELTVDDVCQAARRKEPWACQVMEETLEYLAVAVINVSLLFDPEVVVFHGTAARYADLFLEPVRQRAMVCMELSPPRFAASELGRRASLMGVIPIILHRTTNFYVVRNLW